MQLQYGWNLRETRLYGNLAGAAGLIWNWSGWNRGNGQERSPVNWFDWTDERRLAGLIGLPYC